MARILLLSDQPASDGLRFLGWFSLSWPAIMSRTDLALTRRGGWRTACAGPLYAHAYRL